MSFWFQRGTSKVIINSQGNVVYCDECPCGINCGGCSSMSRCWEITIAGVVNDQCASCANINGTYILEYVSDCEFFVSTGKNIVIFNNLGNCTAATLNFSFKFENGVWNLRAIGQIGGTSPTIHGWSTRISGVFNCTSPTSLAEDAILGDNAGCQGWPSSVTIEPVECPV